MANVGSIEYDVDVDTSDVLKAEKAVDGATKRISSDFNKLDKQVSKTSKSVKTGFAGMGRGAGQAGVQIQQFVGQVIGVTYRDSRLSRALDRNSLRQLCFPKWNCVHEGRVDLSHQRLVVLLYEADRRQ